MKKVISITLTFHLFFSALGLLFPVPEDYNYYFWKLIVSQIYATPASLIAFYMLYEKQEKDE